MRKGISLTIRTLVLLALALIVLISLVTIYMGTVPGGGKSLNCEAKLQTVCTKYSRCGCCEDGTADKCEDTSCPKIFQDYTNTSCPQAEEIKPEEVCC